jgi:hypothetical protein
VHFNCNIPTSESFLYRANASVTHTGGVEKSEDFLVGLATFADTGYVQNSIDITRPFEASTIIQGDAKLCSKSLFLCSRHFGVVEVSVSRFWDCKFMGRR